MSATVFLFNNVAGSDTTATQHTQPDEIVSRDAKRVKTGATPAVVVVKSREDGLLDISRTVCAREQAAACKVEVVSRAHSHVLFLITNDVGWKPKNNADRDNTPTSTPMNYVVLRVLDSVGFNSHRMRISRGPIQSTWYIAKKKVARRMSNRLKWLVWKK